MKRILALLLVSIPALAQQPPVILLNGFDVGSVQSGQCTPATSSTGTFGRLEELLRAAGREVVFFDNCAFGTPPIEELGRRLGETIAELGTEQVDLIGYSMGGLIVRAYLSGKAEAGGLAPPRDRCEGVFLATPLGSSWPSGDRVEIQQLRLGGRFVWDLAT